MCFIDDEYLVTTFLEALEPHPVVRYMPQLVFSGGDYITDKLMKDFSKTSIRFQWRLVTSPTLNCSTKTLVKSVFTTTVLLARIAVPYLST